MVKPYYSHAGITIYHGDCREILPQLEVDAVLTDPPYLEGDFSWLLDVRIRPIVATPGKLRSFDWIAKERPSWEYAWRGSSRSLGGSACLHIGFEPVLAYGMPHTPLGNDVLDYPITTYYAGGLGQPAKDHPWPKPEKLFGKLVAHWTQEGQTVCDPFCGTGTTLVAAKNHKRRAIGIEIEEKYCEIAARRLSQEVFDFK